MRRKSLYKNLFTFVIVIFLISVIVMGALLFGTLGNFFTERKEESLRSIGREISEITVVLAQNRASAQVYSLNVKSISDATDTEIIVVDNSGNVVISSIENFAGPLKGAFLEGIKEGKSKTYRGKIGGSTDVNMLSVREPIIHNSQVAGAVLVTIPVPEIASSRQEILVSFCWHVAIVGCIVAILLYFLAGRITKPISKLSRAAKSIAQGNFKERVEIDEIEEIAELGETFNEMAESIEQFENRRNSFVANISHDLRTPMTTITGFVQGILDGTIPEEKHEWYLSIVLDESKRLSRIVTDLLDISKLEQGSFNLEPSDFDINELVRLTVIKFEKKITDKNIMLSIEFERDGLFVNADKDAISRVLTNLLDNAIKFTDEGGFMDIRVGTKNSKIFVSVQNSGLGIAEDELSHIFDRFYKTDKSRSLDKNGAGLGLYIVKSIMQAHGERVWAESKQGEFARFSFTLKPVEKKKQIEG